MRATSSRSSRSSRSSGSPRSRVATTIDVVEGVYTNLGREPVDAWLTRTAGHLASWFGAGLGAIAHTYDLGGPPSRWSISTPISIDSPPELANVVVESFSSTPPDQIRSYYQHTVGTAATFSALTGMDLRDLPSGSQGNATRLGIIDQLFLHAANTDDRGVVLFVNLPERRTLSATTRRRLAMVSAHVAAGARIALALDTPREPIAILEPNGKLAHVEKAHEGSRSALRARVLDIERARTTARQSESDAEKALTRWKALLAGEYTLLDRFESDGRRYVVACENAPNVRDPRGLTQREAVVAALVMRGHADKLIAYELGIAEGTVAALSSRVMKKLGARSRADLARLLATPATAFDVDVPGAPGAVALATDAKKPPSLASLTRSERLVAKAVAEGLSNDAIARRRAVSTNTVAKQLTRVFEKLGVDNRAALARMLV